MKVIVNKNTKVALFVVFDRVEVESYPDHIILVDKNSPGPFARIVFHGLNAETVEVHTTDSVPSDWDSYKYKFDGLDWTLAPKPE